MHCNISSITAADSGYLYTAAGC